MRMNAAALPRLSQRIILLNMNPSLPRGLLQDASEEGVAAATRLRRDQGSHVVPQRGEILAVDLFAECPAFGRFQYSMLHSIFPGCQAVVATRLRSSIWRSIFPVPVFGSSSQNSTMRGYL